MILPVFVILVSCDRGRVFEENIEIPGRRWNSEQAYSFKPGITDTSKVHHIYVNVRNSSEYPYSNLFLFVKVTSPSGNFINDTLELTLADERGYWLGRGVANVFFSQKMYKPSVRFPEPGIYEFDLTQGMRDLELMGIRSVGLRIEHVDE